MAEPEQTRESELASRERERPENTHTAHDHERSDFSAAGVLKFVGVLVAFIVVVHLIMLGLLALVTAQTRGREDDPTTLGIQYRLPKDLAKIPAPRLQQDDVADLEALRREEDAKLNEFRWIDRDKGIVQVPITEAMRILSDRKKANAHGVTWRETKRGVSRVQK